MSLQTIFLVIGLLTLCVTLVSLRREHIRTEHSVSWLAVGTILTLLALAPNVLDRVARYLDLEPRLCFLIVGGVLISALVFEISHVVSKLRDENVVLAQRIAILEYRLRQPNRGNDHNGG